MSFESPTPEGYHYLGRNHRFVEQLCQFVMANTLARVDKRAARAAVIRTRQVATKTTLLLFRCRNVIEQSGKGATKIVAEEMILWGWRGTPQQKEFLDHAEAKALARVSASHFGSHHPSAGGFPRQRAEDTGLTRSRIRRRGRRTVEKARRSARALQRADGHASISKLFTLSCRWISLEFTSFCRMAAKLRIARELSEHPHRRRDPFAGYPGPSRRCSGAAPGDFGLDSSAKVKDEILRAWADAQDYWRIFQRKLESLKADSPPRPKPATFGSFLF